MANKDFSANLPVEQDQFPIYCDAHSKLCRPNPVLQALEALAVIGGDETETNASNVTSFIRPVGFTDAEDWERLRCELWPDGREDHGPGIAAFFAGTLPELEAVLVAEDCDREIIAFAELSIQTDSTSLVGQRVGCVEGLYVVREARGSGVARALLLASRDWSRRAEVHWICK